MKTFFRSIVATLLFVTFSSFIMANANPESSNVAGKAKTIILADYAITMDAKTTVFNDTGNDMDFTAIITADLVGDKQARNFVTNYTTDGIKMENTKDPNIILYDVENATIHTAKIYPNFNGAKDVSMYQNQEVVNVTDVGTKMFTNVNPYSGTNLKSDVSQVLRNGTNEAVNQNNLELSNTATNHNYGMIKDNFIDAKNNIITKSKSGYTLPNIDNMIVATYRNLKDQTINRSRNYTAATLHFNLQDLQALI